MRYITAAFLLFIVVFAQAQTESGLELGATAPDWILPNAHQEYVSFYQDSVQQPAVLLFWSTWCPACAELLPELNTLRERLQSQGVNFYAINIWEDGDPVAYMARNKFAFTQLLQGDMVAKRYGISNAPGLVVVDADKKVRYIRDADANVEAVCDAVENALIEVNDENNAAGKAGFAAEK